MRYLLMVVSLLAAAGEATAQDHRFDLGGQIAIAGVGRFDTSDIGVGARLGWRTGVVGVEGEVNAYPGEFPDTAAAFSSSRFEALFGVTIGPRLGIVRPFARVRPGVLRYAEAPGPIVCIAIFPPPLSCRLAAGQALAVLDVGGGVEIGTGERTFFRLDIGDRIVRYPEPNALGHDTRVGLGWAVRF